MFDMDAMDKSSACGIASSFVHDGSAFDAPDLYVALKNFMGPRRVFIASFSIVIGASLTKRAS